MGKWLRLPREVWCLRQGPLLTAMDWQADEYLLDKSLMHNKRHSKPRKCVFSSIYWVYYTFFHNLAITTIIKMKNYEKNYSQIELKRRRAWHGKHFITFFQLWPSPKQKAINLAKTDCIRFVFVLHQWQVSMINYHCSFLTVFHRPRPVFDCFFFFSFLLFLTKEKETKRRRKENRQNDFMLRDLCICQLIFFFVTSCTSGY